jgi:hypothetical protein
VPLVAGKVARDGFERIEDVVVAAKKFIARKAAREHTTLRAECIDCIENNGWMLSAVHFQSPMPSRTVLSSRTSENRVIPSSRCPPARWGLKEPTGSSEPALDGLGHHVGRDAIAVMQGRQRARGEKPIGQCDLTIHRRDTSRKQRGRDRVAKAADHRMILGNHEDISKAEVRRSLADHIETRVGASKSGEVEKNRAPAKSGATP